VVHPDIWSCPEAANYLPGTDLTGYKVEAQDGGIGTVDKHSAEAGSCYVVVDTGPWSFGKQVLLPAGVISSVDTEREVVHVSRTKEEIKNAPEYVPDEHDRDGGRRMAFADYYLAFFR
jgi:hypothetical protein